MKPNVPDIESVILEIPEGESSYDYVVGEHGVLALAIVGKNLAKAQCRVTVHLAGTGATAVITGMLLTDHDGSVGLHTLQSHEAPDTMSDLLVKTVLRDRSKSYYDGGIVVAKNAQKTNAYQRNENLLLSPHAYAESKPSLEILANDVRCTHGATAGPIDPEQLWYLESRGIPAGVAETCIVDGFIESALTRITDTKMRETVQKLLPHAV